MPRMAIFCLLLAGCAGVPPQAPRLERISAEELEARLPQPASSIGLADIVSLSRAGTPPATIIERLKKSGARYRLSATQLLELSAQDVDKEVLDHLVEAERRAIFEDMAGELDKHRQACERRLQQETLQCQAQCQFQLQLQTAPLFWPHPFVDCWPPHPGYPYWRCF